MLHAAVLDLIANFEKPRPCQIAKCVYDGPVALHLVSEDPRQGLLALSTTGQSTVSFPVKGRRRVTSVYRV